MAQSSSQPTMIRPSSQPGMARPLSGVAGPPSGPLSSTGRSVQSNERRRNLPKSPTSSGDPSRLTGNPEALELPESMFLSPPTDAFAENLPVLPPRRQLEDLDRFERLNHWMSAFEMDEEGFKSKAVFVEMRLRQGLASSVQLGMPNAFHVAIVCDAFERVAPLTGRLEGVLVLIWRELVRAIFSDYTHELPGSGARAYAERVPYFLEAKRLRETMENQEKTMKRMRAQREAEIKATEGQNSLLNKTLGAWNRAMGSASGGAEAETLKQRVEALEKLLADALADIQKLQSEQDPAARCINAYDACQPEEQEQVCQYVLKSEAAAKTMVGNSAAEVAEYISHLLSKLPEDMAADPAEATRSRVMSHLSSSLRMSDDDKLSVAHRILVDHDDVRMAGETLAGVLVAKGFAHKEACAGMALRLHADEGPDYYPESHDADAQVSYQVLNSLRASLAGVGPDGQPLGMVIGPDGRPLPGFGGVGKDGRPLAGGVAGKAGSRAGGFVDANGNYIDPAAAAAELAGIDDRMAELLRRQEAGELTDEERVELQALEKRKAELKSGLAKGAAEAAAADESEAIATRMAELKRRQEAGELTPEELAELQALEVRKAELQQILGPDHMTDSELAAAQAESAALADRIADLKRRQAAGELTPEEMAELQKLEARKAELDSKVEKGKQSKKNRGGGDDDAAAEYDAAAAERDKAATRLAELEKRKKAGKLTPEEQAEMEALDKRMKQLDSVLAAGRPSSNGLTKEIGVQAGEAMGKGGKRGKGGTMGDDDSSATGPGGKRGLPAVAATSLCEIRFDRKDVKAMNVLMCRRLVAALYQVKVDLNSVADNENAPRSDMPNFVPDQFVVLYGIKSLAIKNINSFMYGIRAERRRKNAAGVEEEEPMLYFFWKACWHGVPPEERLSQDDFDFYLDLLAMLAKLVSDEHTFNLKGGAFWNCLGSMEEMRIPLFALQNTVRKCFPNHHELVDRINRAVGKAAADFVKLVKGPKPPQPAPSYKIKMLGSETQDSRGYLELDKFLSISMEQMKQQRIKDGRILQGIYDQWSAGSSESGFDIFAEMLTASSPNMDESKIITLYQKATSGEDPDKVDMSLIELPLRKANIHIKRKEGMTSVTDGVGDIDDLKLATTALSLFGGKPKSLARGLPAADASKGGGDGVAINMRKWQKAGQVLGKSRGLIRDLFENGAPNIDDVSTHS